MGCVPKKGQSPHPRKYCQMANSGILSELFVSGILLRLGFYGIYSENVYSMVTIAATDLKNKLGQVIDQARREPVLVQNHGRDVVVILDHAEFSRLRQIEDIYWIARAEGALKSGFLAPEETMAQLQARYESASEG